MTAPVLEVRGLCKSFGAIRAVDDVSFAVMPGEIFGVIGPNGSGKTTVFNAVLGQIAPSAGTIALLGRDVTELSPRQLSRRGVGRTFQSLQVFGQMTVRDNLVVAAQEHRGTMLGRLFAPPDHGLGPKAAELLALFGLGDVADRRAGELSYGQQKLVDIAMAFMSDPVLVLLDEPCAGVNPRLVDELCRLLDQLNRARGKSFIVIEHNMEFVQRLCHRVLVMAEGRVLAVGTPAEIRANQQVLDAYLGS
jgi:branched-chain amino acid transport system ATP-binding protein